MDPDSIKEVSKAETLASPAVVQTVTSAKPITRNQIWRDWTIEPVPSYNLFHDKGRGNDKKKVG